MICVHVFLHCAQDQFFIPLDMLPLTNLKSLIIGSNLFGGSGVGDGPKLYQAVYWDQKKIQMNNIFSMN